MKNSALLKFANSPKQIKMKVIHWRGCNIRRDKYDKKIWRRAGMPRKWSNSGALPFAWFSPFNDGRELTLLIDNKNKLYYKNSGDKTITLLASLSAKPILAKTSTEGFIRLLLKHSPDVYLTYDRDLMVTLHGEMPEIPAIRIMASGFNTLYTKVPAISLSGTSQSTSGSQLNSTDCRLLTNTLIDSYNTLIQSAKNSRYCAQPVMTRYRLLDAAGNSLAVGPTIALSTADGFSATSSITQTSSDSLQTLSEGRIEMGVYRPAVIAPNELPAPWNKLISKLVIEMTDEIDPLDSNLSAPHAIQRNSQSGLVTVTSHLPGFAVGTTIDKGRLQSLGQSAMKAPMRIAAEFNNPFGGGIASAGSIVTFSAPESSSATTSSDNDSVGVEMRSWSAALDTGKETILCNPLLRSLGGWSPDCFIASRDAEISTSWRLATSVKLSTPAGDVRVKNEYNGVGLAPTSLGSVISYPSEDASEIRFTYLSPNGVVYEADFPLTPIIGRGYASYVSPGMERILLTKTVSSYLPLGSTPTARLETGVAEIYHSSDIGQLVDSYRVSTSPIHTVKVAPRSGSGWDFSRLKLLFFGESGTLLATLGSNATFHSVAPIDNRPIYSADTVTDATGSAGATIIAYAGDDLISISGQKVTTLIPALSQQIATKNERFSDVAIGWEERFNEIWLTTSLPDTPLLRITENGDIIEARLPGISTTNEASTTSPLRFCQKGATLLLATDSATYDLSDEEQSGLLAVSIQKRLQTEEMPEWLTANIFASTISGSFTLSGDRGTEISERLLRINLSGAINSPISVRLAAPYRQWLETAIDIEASADLAIHDEIFNR